MKSILPRTINEMRNSAPIKLPTELLENNKYTEDPVNNAYANQVNIILCSLKLRDY